jgi:DNA-binding NarL/FixJ family response regulator
MTTRTRRTTAMLRKIAARRRPSHRKGIIPSAASPPSTLPARVMPPKRFASLPGLRILTPREMEVLRLVAEGQTDRGIADRLYLSRRTVSCHVSHILDKLDVPSRVAAVITADRIGLL